ncbi:hypothetical protein BDN72DRAFT_214169 [Pluteus cervinus]|uniref:Uncharacterized protein n=1 Tax=Pluteus cervinus TaxID=181527 RepID=A0ACD3B631_9AGAR|nr:hypothetical protein BDN72DRAFT_214169 [Pluteus cervinus]
MEWCEVNLNLKVWLLESHRDGPNYQKTMAALLTQAYPNHGFPTYTASGRATSYLHKNHIAILRSSCYGKGHCQILSHSIVSHMITFHAQGSLEKHVLGNAIWMRSRFHHDLRHIPHSADRSCWSRLDPNQVPTFISRCSFSPCWTHIKGE